MTPAGESLIGDWGGGGEQEPKMKVDNKKWSVIVCLAETSKIHVKIKTERGHTKKLFDIKREIESGVIKQQIIS
jgi:hypothetical protein